MNNIKIKKSWAMPNKQRGIGTNVAGAKSVSPHGGRSESIDSRGQKYTRLPSGEIRKQPN